MDETTGAEAAGPDVPETPETPDTRFEPLTALDLAELALGLAAVGVETVGRVVERVRPPSLVTGVVSGVVTAPVTATLTELGSRLRRADWAQELLRRGRSRRGELGRAAEVTAQRVAAVVVEAVLDLVDLTDIVVDHVDLDAVVHAVDLDRAVARVDIGAVIDRVDIDAIVERVDIDAIVERLDIDAIVARVDLDRAVSRVDIGAVIERLDIDAIVAGVDLDRAVSGVDIDAIVARVDLDRTVSGVDIDAIVGRVDIDAILDRVDVNAIAQRLDLDAVVARLDLIGLAEYVVEEIDLPGIIQSSSGAMASEGMREVRWQGVGADERVAHVVDRMLRRRPRTPGPALPANEIAGAPVLPGTPG
ncbi:hypothetical protein ASG96_21055 [Terrabacter sp. Soil810]|nr:hypothetical protein [Terrabacter sp. Soil810]KRF46124.1 hypothetical protein ASG96_21055 [Terrabacter sp. Soil810]